MWHSASQDLDAKLFGNVGFGSGCVYYEYGSTNIIELYFLLIRKDAGFFLSAELFHGGFKRYVAAFDPNNLQVQTVNFNFISI